ncbi:hypothetical protein HLRTI_001014 [Halorhabdus tiamatea SARL4B]|uniref:Uncharacterized protein n=1 Tax=Halorhabdus tiamatea SARL4B TaxID=1033806 RepID=F7PHU2_9EURY|nr:hypothetical protein [Halorhabdus tiamatea]ERJ06936.1 hypothetical protein HLRTI_001014 [Halorhabdus tiamatea SARL4B]CCQ32363.1 conserved hypothetical protein [Halorhabdus tiamatea SARL4B]
MRRPSRAISTVADVTLAILLIVAAMGVLATFVDSEQKRHDPMTAEYTAETIASGTMNVTYDVEAAIDDYADLAGVDADADYTDKELKRRAHGPIVAHAAAAAVRNLEVDRDALRDGSGHGTVELSKDAAYERAVDEALQTRLVESSFDTQVIAVWEPIEGGPLRGAATLGQTPPVDADVSATTITVPVDVPSVRQRTVDRVDDPDDFGIVANAVASAVIDGYLPERRSQRALESAGVRHDLTAYRYRRLATVLRTPTNGVESTVVPVLDRRTANASVANTALTRALGTQLEADLESADPARPAAGPLGNGTAAAERVSTGTVTITVRTWN